MIPTGGTNQLGTIRARWNDRAWWRAQTTRKPTWRVRAANQTSGAQRRVDLVDRDRHDHPAHGVRRDHPADDRVGQVPGQRVGVQDEPERHQQQEERGHRRGHLGDRGPGKHPFPRQAQGCDTQGKPAHGSRVAAQALGERVQPADGQTRVGALHARRPPRSLLTPGGSLVPPPTPSVGSPMVPPAGDAHPAMTGRPHAQTWALRSSTVSSGARQRSSASCPRMNASTASTIWSRPGCSIG